MSPLNHLTCRKIFTFLKFHTKISFSEMFVLLDIRLTPLTVLLGQKTCCKSLKITSPDRICHFVITKNDNRQLKSYFTYQKAALWETTVRTFLFFLTCATKKNTSTWEFPLPVTFANDWEVQRSILLCQRWKLDTHRVSHISKVAVSVEYSQKESVL